MNQELCKHFNDCGGCDMQDRVYSEQLAIKEGNLKTLFKELAIGKIAPMIPSPQHWYYRNKMEYVAGPGDTGISIGLRRKKKFYKIVNLDECRIFYDGLDEIFSSCKDWAADFNIKPYDLFKHTGTLRYLAMRHSKFYDEMMVLVVIQSALCGVETEKGPYLNLADRLRRVKSVKSVYLAINNGVADVSVTADPILIYGERSIRERLNGIDYLIDPLVFFQTNSYCSAELYEAVGDEAAAAAGSGLGLDLYCGSGGLTLQVAPYFDKVVGIDISPKNVGDAARNAELNKIKNVEFIKDDALAFLKNSRLSGELEKFSTIIVDPPRSGLGRKASAIISESAIPAMIYVSCNPKTLVDDLRILNAYYRIKKVIPVDMFPHTKHMEVITVLEKIKS